MLSRIVARGPRLSPAAWPFPPGPLSASAGEAPAGDDHALSGRRDRGLTRSAHSHSVRAPDTFCAQVGAPQLSQPKGTSWRFRKARVDPAPESASATASKEVVTRQVVGSQVVSNRLIRR
jgi:hypothetical protein